MEEKNLNEEVVVEVEETGTTDIATYEMPEEPESNGQLNAGAIVLGGAILVGGCLLVKKGIQMGVEWIQKRKAKKQQETEKEWDPAYEDDVVDVEPDEETSEEELLEEIGKQLRKEETK